ncbi:MAG: hypothetical protein ACI4VX_08600 [Succinivibrionaceae bacterium]
MFRFILAILLLALLAVFGFYFGYSNMEPIEVNLLFVKIKTNVAAALAVSFTFGFIVSLFIHYIWLGIRKFFSVLFPSKSKQPADSK